MFLSRLSLDPDDLAVQRDVADAEQMHRTIMRAFPQHQGDDARSAFGVLFRIETSERQSAALVQSAVAPRWEFLPDGYLRSADFKDIAPFVASIEAGSRFRFRLLANPTYKVADDRRPARSGYNSRRKAILDEEGRFAWMARRAERAGFELSGLGHRGGLRQVQRPPLGRGGKGRKGIHVRPALFEGQLTITEPATFREALTAGIGPAKAYGCGLLSIGYL